MLGKQSLEVRESTKKPIHPDDVRDAISKASAAVFADVAKERFAMPNSWLTLRPAFHNLSADERRLIALKLLIEEGSRIRNDEGSRFHPVSNPGQR